MRAGVLKTISERLDGIEGTLSDFNVLIHNHITDYTTKFGRLRKALEDERKYNEVRDKALQDGMSVFRWVLALVATFTVISLGGFVALAIWAVNKIA